MHHVIVSMIKQPAAPLYDRTCLLSALFWLIFHLHFMRDSWVNYAEQGRHGGDDIEDCLVAC